MMSKWASEPWSFVFCIYIYSLTVSWKIWTTRKTTLYKTMHPKSPFRRPSKSSKRKSSISSSSTSTLKMYKSIELLRNSKTNSEQNLSKLLISILEFLMPKNFMNLNSLSTQHLFSSIAVHWWGNVFSISDKISGTLWANGTKLISLICCLMKGSLRKTWNQET